jgi:tripartite-type tricarboxylate transporter receptor subunit TctC
MNLILPRRALLALALLAAGTVSAQTWPTGPIKIVVPFPAGGSVDMVARAVASA